MTIFQVAGLSVLKLADWQIVNYDFVALAKTVHRHCSDQAFKFSFVLSPELYGNDDYSRLSSLL